MIVKLVSGGQTGVDRAALDVALKLKLPHGGWCPRGRRAEDGEIDARYTLEETPSNDYVQRTEWNVRDTDVTLILNEGALLGGTELTVKFAEKHAKPFKIIALDAEASLDEVRDWLKSHPVNTLNVAGPRESKCPGIESRAKIFLEQLLGPVNFIDAT